MKKCLIALFFMLVLLFVVIGLKSQVNPDEVTNETGADTFIHLSS